MTGSDNDADAPRKDIIDVVLPVLDEAGALPWVLTRFPDRKSTV